MFVKASIDGTFRYTDTEWDNMTPEWSRTLDMGCPSDENEPLVLTMIEVRAPRGCRPRSVRAERKRMSCRRVSFNGPIMNLEFSPHVLHLSRGRQDDMLLYANDEKFSCDISDWSNADPGTMQSCQQAGGDGEILFRIIFTESFDNRAIVPVYDLDDLFAEHLAEVSESRHFGKLGVSMSVTMPSGDDPLGLVVKLLYRPKLQYLVACSDADTCASE